PSGFPRTCQVKIHSRPANRKDAGLFYQRNGYRNGSRRKVEDAGRPSPARSHEEAAQSHGRSRASHQRHHAETYPEPNSTDNGIDERQTYSGKTTSNGWRQK